MSPSPLLPPQEKARPARPPHEVTAAAWRTLGRFGFVLALVGLIDILLVFYPWRMGDPSWEFGVIDGAVSSLPLLLVGFAALLGSAVARQKVTLARVLAAFSILLGLAIFAGYLLYLSDVPLALKAAPRAVIQGIYKSIARTSIIAVAFATTFILSGIATLRTLRSA